MSTSKYISDEWNLNKKGHSYFDFVDVAINSDNRLFIDPCLIEMSGNDWSKSAMEKISTFMNELVAAYSNRDTVSIPAPFEPPVRILRATIPVVQSHCSGG